MVLRDARDIGKKQEGPGQERWDKLARECGFMYKNKRIRKILRKKKRIFRINYKDKSYVLDSIKNGYIENIDFNSNSKKLSTNKILYDNDSTPLEIVVKEFIEDVENKKVSFYDLELSIKTINLLEQICFLSRK